MAISNHYICDTCWYWHIEEREPVRVKKEYSPIAPCCICKKETQSGIFLRGKDEEFQCNGEHIQELN